MQKKIVSNIFFVLACVAVTAALWVSKDLLFPFVTTKAFIFRIAIELALPLYLYLLILDPKLRPNLKNPLSLAVLAFVAINFASSFSGVNSVRSLWGNFERMGGAYYLAHLAALYFYVLCLSQMQGQYLQRFLKVLLLVAVVVAGNGVFGWLHLPTFVQDPSLPDRVSSTLGNPIYLGSFLIIPLYFSLFFFGQAESTAKKVGYGILAFLFLLGIFLSGTRGAVVGLILGSFICAVIYLFLTPSKKIKLYGLMAVAVLVVAAGVLFSFSNKLPQGSTLQRVFRLNDSNTESRLLQWKVALKGYKDRPLLGTGPENYYIVANQYYNPEIYKYDGSWFDKPHNYLLEILVTNGLLGFLAYAAILIFMVIALWRGFKVGLYGLAEFCFLLAAFLAYQIQNLTVFDTVPASLMFYAFLGFTGYIWNISGEQVKQEKPAKEVFTSYGQALPVAVLAVSLAVAGYAIYATNAVPMVIAKNVNYGYAYASVDPSKADGFFTTAISLPFNFDKTETAGKFSDFAVGLARAASPQNKDLAAKVLDQAVGYLQQAVVVQADYPILWQHLSTAYIFKGLQTGKVDPRAEDAILKAIALAPKRDEASLTLAEIYGLEGKLPEAQKLLEAAVAGFPQDRNAKVQLAMLYRIQGKLDLAAGLMEKAAVQGYVFSAYGDIKWLVDFYAKEKQWDKAVALEEQASKIEPNNFQLFIDLAHLYAQAGKADQAKALAQAIINYDASKKAEMQAILDSLPKTASSTPTSELKK